jgi:hypothetical protein
LKSAKRKSVMPAEAGIQCGGEGKRQTLDSLFRGNDGREIDF